MQPILFGQRTLRRKLYRTLGASSANGYGSYLPPGLFDVHTSPSGQTHWAAMGGSGSNGSYSGSYSGSNSYVGRAASCQLFGTAGEGYHGSYSTSTGCMAATTAITEPRRRPTTYCGSTGGASAAGMVTAAVADAAVVSARAARTLDNRLRRSQRWFTWLPAMFLCGPGPWWQPLAATVQPAW